LVISYIFFIFAEWDLIKNKFLTIHLSDVIGNIATLFIGIIMAYLYNIHFANKSKKIDIIVSVFDMYIEDLDNLMKVLHLKHDPEFETHSYNKEILYLLRNASNDLNAALALYIKCIDQNELTINKYKQEFFDLKIVITGTPILDRNDLIGRHGEMDSSYYIIKSSIHFLKLSFYQ
jgi:hypothetical protein